ncbi:hypothetical protein E1A91_A07G055200v1 [Gossypium mustelinum]|uniref:Uncharacterized protein n=1 Tax=Gossypium mustelinum TaxID=34275 RepID=A0A5D2YGJ1_GOSMU|nr:hypothetical protein E1A91_A07G055200v1 [Gossypium mustelinum]
MKGETPIFLFESRFQRWSRAPMWWLRGSGKWSKWGGWPTMEWVMVTDSREAHLGNIFFECSSMEEVVDIVVDFENYFPSMVERYGAKWLLRELRNELKLLIDGEREVIMLESLKTKSVMLGRSDMEDDEIVCMLSESDLDGDCALNQKIK